jgi:hypothetical protein
MATAKKMTLADKIRAYQLKNPNASAIQVAKACKTTPTYVYALRASDKGKAAKTPKKEVVNLNPQPSTQGRERRHPVTGKILMQGMPMVEAPITMIEPQADRVEDHPLYAVFVDAIKQAMHGKGERHGGARTPFLEQPWAHYTKMHGRGFATGQATKKLEEAASTRTGEAFEQEVFGAIVYAGMAILKERGQV